jgi:hypothetical protein
MPPSSNAYEALAMHLALERDAAAAGDPDPYVDDELALLHRAAGNETAAFDAEARAAQSARSSPQRRSADHTTTAAQASHA